VLPVVSEPEEDDEFSLLGDVVLEDESGESRSRSAAGAATKTYSSAVAGARSVLMTTSLQGGMEVRHAKRVVQPLVDGAFADQPLVLGLSSLSHHDQYTYAHAVNVTLVAVTMGHFLELDRRALADLGVAALLHDVGKSVVASQIQNSFEQLTRRRSASSSGTGRGPALASSTKLNHTTFRCMRVALEHHAGPDNSGYPSLGAGWRTSLLSRIVAIADCFVSLQMHRSARGSHVTPFEALGMMLGPLKPRFHPAMLWALVQTVGFYPPGQLIELDDGMLAAVLAPNAEDLARPHVRPVIAPDGQPFAAGQMPDPSRCPRTECEARCAGGVSARRRGAIGRLAANALRRMTRHHLAELVRSVGSISSCMGGRPSR
jgi:HD-GYP domain-containing protein (c-di-GMP phosphodiesterase class II)